MSDKLSLAPQEENVGPGIVSSKIFILYQYLIFRLEKGSIQPGSESSEGSREGARKTNSGSEHSESEGSTNLCIL